MAMEVRRGFRPAMAMGITGCLGESEAVGIVPATAIAISAIPTPAVAAEGEPNIIATIMIMTTTIMIGMIRNVATMPTGSLAAVSAAARRNPRAIIHRNGTNRRDITPATSGWRMRTARSTAVAATVHRRHHRIPAATGMMTTARRHRRRVRLHPVRVIRKMMTAITTIRVLSNAAVVVAGVLRPGRVAVMATAASAIDRSSAGATVRG